jgi:hypothetical protein
VRVCNSDYICAGTPDDPYWKKKGRGSTETTLRGACKADILAAAAEVRGCNVNRPAHASEHCQASRLDGMSLVYMRNTKAPHEVAAVLKNDQCGDQCDLPDTLDLAGWECTAAPPNFSLGNQPRVEAFGGVTVAYSTDATTTITPDDATTTITPDDATTITPDATTITPTDATTITPTDATTITPDDATTTSQSTPSVNAPAWSTNWRPSLAAVEDPNLGSLKNKHIGALQEATLSATNTAAAEATQEARMTATPQEIANQVASTTVKAAPMPNGFRCEFRAPTTKRACDSDAACPLPLDRESDTFFEAVRGMNGIVDNKGVHDLLQSLQDEHDALQWNTTQSKWLSKGRKTASSTRRGLRTLFKTDAGFRDSARALMASVPAMQTIQETARQGLCDVSGTCAAGGVAPSVRLFDGTRSVSFALQQDGAVTYTRDSVQRTVVAKKCDQSDDTFSVCQMATPLTTSQLDATTPVSSMYRVPLGESEYLVHNFVTTQEPSDCAVRLCEHNRDQCPAPACRVENGQCVPK